MITWVSVKIPWIAKDTPHTAFPALDMPMLNWLVNQSLCGQGLGHVHMVVHSAVYQSS